MKLISNTGTNRVPVGSMGYRVMWTTDTAPAVTKDESFAYRIEDVEEAADDVATWTISVPADP